MSSEYIFEINDALYDHETGKVCMMPIIVGKRRNGRESNQQLEQEGNEL